MARAAVPGRLTRVAEPQRANPWQNARVLAIRRRDRADEDVPPRARRAHEPSGGPALRRAPHCTRRLHRVSARTRSRRRPTAPTSSSSPSSASRAVRCRGSSTTSWRWATSSRCAGRSVAWFVWDGATPAVLLGGGSGVVPLMAMVRLARATRSFRSRAPRRVGAITRRPLLRRRDRGPRDHHRLHAGRAERVGCASPAASPSTTSNPCCCPTRPRTSADRRGSPMPRPICSTSRASAPSASASSVSGRADDGGERAELRDERSARRRRGLHLLARRAGRAGRVRHRARGRSRATCSSAPATRPTTSS